MKRVTLVGGGLLGLSIAYYLTKKGIENVRILEAEDRLGGVCSWTTLGDLTVDRFYHVILSEDRAVLGLLGELGLSESCRFTHTRIGLFDGSRCWPMNSALDFLKYPGLRAIDKARLAFSFIRARTENDWRSLESVRALEWLEKTAGKRNAEVFWRPILRAKFGECVDELAASDLWMRMRRLSGSRKQGVSQQFASIRGTPKTLIDGLEVWLRQRGVEIITGCAVRSLSESGGQVQRVETDKGSFDSDLFVFTVSCPAFARMIPDTRNAYKRDLLSIQYLDNLSLILLLEKPLVPFYMLNIGDMNCPFTGIIGLSEVYPKEEFGGRSVFYISRYIRSGSWVSKPDKEAVLKEYLPYLQRLDPAFSERSVLASQLSYGREIECLHSLGYSSKIPSRQTIFKNGFLLNTSQIYPQATVLNESVRIAESFVNEIF